MGLFISIEGPDGSGKTLQSDLLQKELESAGYTVVRTREPGGPRLSEEIRGMLLDPANKVMAARTEALLYAASRAQHVEDTIRPALERGEIVLCDRFVDSSLIYQGIGRELGVETVRDINLFATGGLLPDVTIVIQIDYEEGLRRKNVQNGKLDRMEQQGDSFHRKVHEGFYQLSEWDPNRVKVVDGVGSIEEVHQKVMDVLTPYLPERLTDRTH